MSLVSDAISGIISGILSPILKLFGKRSDQQIGADEQSLVDAKKELADVDTVKKVSDGAAVASIADKRRVLSSYESPE